MGVVIESASPGSELAEVMEHDMSPENAWRVDLDPAGDVRLATLGQVLTRQAASGLLVEADRRDRPHHTVRFQGHEHPRTGGRKHTA